MTHTTAAVFKDEPKLHRSNESTQLARYGLRSMQGAAFVPALGAIAARGYARALPHNAAGTV